MLVTVLWSSMASDLGAFWVFMTAFSVFRSLPFTWAECSVLYLTGLLAPFSLICFCQVAPSGKPQVSRITPYRVRGRSGLLWLIRLLELLDANCGCEYASFYLFSSWSERVVNGSEWRDDSQGSEMSAAQAISSLEQANPLHCLQFLSFSHRLLIFNTSHVIMITDGNWSGGKWGLS